MGCIQSLLQIGVFRGNDTVVQMSQCSFDIHVGDIIGTLVSGAQLIMLRPDGNSDFEYLLETCERKQITHMHTVPSLLSALSKDFKSRGKANKMKYLRSVCSGGKYSVLHSCVSNMLFFNYQENP
jgi:non-ribosomal peptide synthetase component F